MTLNLRNKTVELMLWFVIFSIIISAVLSYMAVAPFYLEIDSVAGLYRIRYHRLASAKLVTVDGSLKVDLKIAWRHKQLDLFEGKTQSERPLPAKKRRPGIDLNVIAAVIKSFKIKRCYVTIDTGNMPMNGMLYPVFYILSNHTGKTFEINFLDRNEVILEIENNLARIVRAFINQLFINKKRKKWTI